MAGSIKHTSRTTDAPLPTPDTRSEDLSATASAHNVTTLLALHSHAAFLLNWNTVQGPACFCRCSRRLYVRGYARISKQLEVKGSINLRKMKKWPSKHICDLRYVAVCLERHAICMQS